jgi:hypothetical protein
MMASLDYQNKIKDFLNKLGGEKKKSGVPKVRIQIDRDEIESEIKKALKAQHELLKGEFKTQLIDFAKDVSFSLDGILRAFIDLLQAPEQALDTAKIINQMNSIQQSYSLKYQAALTEPAENLKDVFLDTSSMMEELEKHSKLLMDTARLKISSEQQPKTTDPSVPNESKAIGENTVQELSKKPTGNTKEVGKEAKGGFLSGLLSKFKKDEGYIKTSLGKDNSGMRWCDTKKK